MMENNNNSGLFGGMGAQSNIQGLSPYLNIDTSYLQSSPEYLFDQETKRGKMEKSFSAIGTAVCFGSGLGGAYGIYDGVRQTALSDLSGKLRRTQIMNYMLKGGASAGNALGTVAVVYSLTHCLISLTAYEEDDELKSLVSGTVAGAVFKSTAGIKKCALGGAIGLGLATIWAYGLKRQESVQNYM
jgi:import inner membrane translocase subunit TIM23